jgi:hypothetical protein
LAKNGTFRIYRLSDFVLAAIPATTRVNVENYWMKKRGWHRKV